MTAGTQVERSFRSNALPGDQEIRCPCDVIRTGWAGGGAVDTTRLLNGYARFLAIVEAGYSRLTHRRQHESRHTLAPQAQPAWTA